MKRIFIFAAIIAILAPIRPSSAQSETTWTLEQCLHSAMRQAPRLTAGAQTAAAAAAAAREANANRWPTLGVSGAYSYTSETQVIEIPIPPVPKHISFGDGNVYDFAATARVPFYTGGTLSQKARADVLGRDAALSDLRADSLKLAADVRRAYFSALGGEARAEAVRQSAQRLQRHLDELTAAQTIGTVSEENRIAALARLRQTEQSLVTAESEAQAARLALGNLVLQPGIEIFPDGNVHECLADSALAPLPFPSRADVSAIESRREQNRRLAKSAGGALLPSLSGTAVYHYGKPGVDMSANEWMNYYTLGLTASWTLWDWQARSQRVEQARAAANALDARRQDAINSLSTRYEAARDALRAAYSAQTKAAERTGLERRRMELVENRLHNGMASESEFLDAQDDLATAETDLVAAIIKLRLAETDLLFAAGY
jgi:outer membrane protein